MKKQLLFVIIIALSANCVAGAQILNGSFEDDSNIPLLWQIDSNGVLPEIRQSFSTHETPYPSDVNVTIGPFEGQYFVLLRSDSLGYLRTNFSRLSQKITVQAGQSITGAYFFSTGDYIPYNDSAIIKLVPDPCSNPAGLTEILLAYMDVASVGSYQTMQDWEEFTYDFNDADAGTYTLILQIEDAIDNVFTSRLAVDALKIVPKPDCPYTLEGDIDDNCKVDFFDLDLLASEWLNNCDSSTWCNNCDINQSSMVDFADFATIAGNWLIDCYAEPENPACVPK